MASEGSELILQAWFPSSRDKTIERKPLTESDIRDITDALHRTSKPGWDKVPRIFSVLKIIDKVEDIDSFLGEDISDVWFPFSQKTLPVSFKDPSARLDFLAAQQFVYNTKAFDLEREQTRHGHFPDTRDVPLKKIGELGKGAYGYVDRVVSTISHREYARKLIRRGITFKRDREILRAFERELSSLKRLSQQHKHIIELIGSYTDPRYVGILMLPVADSNLFQFLNLPLGAAELSLLRNFFGCLTSALCFLHDHRIRHKDIKPQNVLVKDGHVFLTDFGISLDWSELSHSTTTGPTGSTPRYGSPEVSQHIARSSSSDVWSLGCVFLEIWTVLRKQTTQSLYDHMQSTGTQSSCYASNLDGVLLWIKKTENLPGLLTDNAPTTWILHMLKEDREERWTAHTLWQNVHEQCSDPTTPFAFCGLCCLNNDDSAESVLSSINDMGYTTPEVPKLSTEACQLLDNSPAGNESMEAPGRATTFTTPEIFVQAPDDLAPICRDPLQRSNVTDSKTKAIPADGFYSDPYTQDLLSLSRPPNAEPSKVGAVGNTSNVAEGPVATKTSIPSQSDTSDEYTSSDETAISEKIVEARSHNLNARNLSQLNAINLATITRSRTSADGTCVPPEWILNWIISGHTKLISTANSGGTSDERLTETSFKSTNTDKITHSGQHVFRTNQATSTSSFGSTEVGSTEAVTDFPRPWRPSSGNSKAPPFDYGKSGYGKKIDSQLKWVENYIQTQRHDELYCPNTQCGFPIAPISYRRTRSSGNIYGVCDNCSTKACTFCKREYLPGHNCNVEEFKITTQDRAEHGIANVPTNFGSRFQDSIIGEERPRIRQPKRRTTTKDFPNHFQTPLPDSRYGQPSTCENWMEPCGQCTACKYHSYPVLFRNYF
ncbi:kinase-like protein [Aaosphaeria arxii CBS 175.79]|uniref:Kinase-like protein n=1 Tax=Aaosphaeria arxii CBS 175.79 TaxID=1450172 RepID=A0A6A5XV11_9PLEO|nr:kinase-like protein [Aaosphaeria arxii CBS 175.79]KAF2016793.1 kinase-like protein [Aaosphaeria arxii CBS 175.79]